MAGYSYSLISDNPLIRIRDLVIILTEGHINPLMILTLFLGGVGTLSIYFIGMPAINIVGQILSWTFIAASISIVAATCLAIFIVIVDFALVTLKFVEDFHSVNR